MNNNFDDESKNYGDFLDDYKTDYDTDSYNDNESVYDSHAVSQRNSSPHPKKQKANFFNRKFTIPAGRKGLKWKLLAIANNMYVRAAVPALIVLIVIISVISSCAGGKNAEPVATTAQPTTAAPTTVPTSHQIKNVPTILQNELGAGCETYACTILLKYYKFDIDEFIFADKYLILKPVTYGADGNLYGPDMNSAYAGDIYTGYGINAPAMAKSMNNYLKTTTSKLRAVATKGESVENLCRKYIDNNIPVMFWATTSMQEPNVEASWIVDYVDENAEAKVGDTVSWMNHEHCLVLIGYDKTKYYFSDPAYGDIESYDKAEVELRYEQIGKQSIVLQ